MATHRITIKRIMSMIRKTFPNAGETDMFEKINEAQVHAGKYNVKYEVAKSDLTTDKRRYTLSDAYSGIEIMKIYKVSIMDSNGDYIKIPRMLNATVARESLV